MDLPKEECHGEGGKEREVRVEKEVRVKKVRQRKMVGK